jgi:hypothetical protein
MNVEFGRLRSGNPQMPTYKRWATGIVEGLRDQFDEQLIWARTKADYLFVQQVKQLGPVTDNLAPLKQATISNEGIKRQTMDGSKEGAKAEPTGSLPTNK